MAGGSGSDVSRWTTAAAGALALLVAGTCDVLAGEHPPHTATLTMALSVVAAVRIRLAGRFGRTFAALTAALLAQPVLHAVVMLMSGADLGSGQHGAAATSASVGQVLVAVLVVAVVASGELLAVTVVGARSPTGPIRLPRLDDACAPCAAVTRPAETRLSYVQVAPRRGPPVDIRVA